MSERGRSGGRWVVCQNCGRSQPPGFVRCTGCGTCLRPRVLGLFTVAAILVSIAIGATIIDGMVRQKSWGREMDAWAIPQVVAWAIAAFVVFKLGHGRWWAWVAVQVMLAINIAAVPFVFVGLSSAEAIPPHVAQALLLVEAALAGIFWYYLRTDEVRAFLGRKPET